MYAREMPVVCAFATCWWVLTPQKKLMAKDWLWVCNSDNCFLGSSNIPTPGVNTEKTKFKQTQTSGVLFSLIGYNRKFKEGRPSRNQIRTIYTVNIDRTDTGPFWMQKFNISNEHFKIHHDISYCAFSNTLAMQLQNYSGCISVVFPCCVFSYGSLIWQS